MPCHKYEINRENLAGFLMAPKRFWFKTKYALERSQNLAKRSRQKSRLFDKMSMHSVEAILVQIPFVGIYKSVKIYVILCF